MNSKAEIGKAGVYFVQFDLAMQGYRSTLGEEGSPFDLVVFWEHRPLRVQVKTATAPILVRPGQRTPIYFFKTARNFWTENHKRVVSRGYREDEVDVFSFVGLDERLVSYFPYKEIGGVMGVTLRSPSLNYTNLGGPVARVLGDSKFQPQVWFGQEENKTNKKLEVLKEFYERLKVVGGIHEAAFVRN